MPVEPSAADMEKAKAIQFLCMKSPEPRRDRDGYCGNYATCTDMASCGQKIDATALALAEARQEGWDGMRTIAIGLLLKDGPVSSTDFPSKPPSGAGS